MTKADKDSDDLTLIIEETAASSAPSLPVKAPRVGKKAWGVTLPINATDADIESISSPQRGTPELTAQECSSLSGQHERGSSAAARKTTGAVPTKRLSESILHETRRVPGETERQRVDLATSQLSRTDNSAAPSAPLCSPSGQFWPKACFWLACGIFGAVAGIYLCP